MGWSDWMARLRINAALYTCCISSNTPLRLSSSDSAQHFPPTLFFSFLCLVQPQTSLNNWPWLYFTAKHILFYTLVRSVKDQSHVKVPFDHVIMWVELFKLRYPLTFFPVLHFAVTCHRYGTSLFVDTRLACFVRMYSASRTSGDFGIWPNAPPWFWSTPNSRWCIQPYGTMWFNRLIIQLIPKTIGNRKRDCAWGGSGW